MPNLHLLAAFDESSFQEGYSQALTDMTQQAFPHEAPSGTTLDTTVSALIDKLRATSLSQRAVLRSRYEEYQAFEKRIAEPAGPKE